MLSTSDPWEYRKMRKRSEHIRISLIRLLFEAKSDSELWADKLTRAICATIADEQARSYYSGDYFAHETEEHFKKYLSKLDKEFGYKKLVTEAVRKKLASISFDGDTIYEKIDKWVKLISKKDLGIIEVTALIEWLFANVKEDDLFKDVLPEKITLSNQDSVVSLLRSLTNPESLSCKFCIMEEVWIQWQ